MSEGRIRWGLRDRKRRLNMTVPAVLGCTLFVCTMSMQAFPRFSDLNNTLWALVDGSLGTAVERAHAAESLLSQGADPNLRDPTFDVGKRAREVVQNSPFDPRETVLMRAAWRHDIQMVKALIRKGAKPNLQGLYGGTAMDREGEESDIVKLIRSVGGRRAVTSGTDYPLEPAKYELGVEVVPRNDPAYSDCATLLREGWIKKTSPSYFDGTRLLSRTEFASSIMQVLTVLRNPKGFYGISPVDAVLVKRVAFRFSVEMSSIKEDIFNIEEFLDKRVQETLEIKETIRKLPKIMGAPLAPRGH
jgi:hypothetical protein